MLKQKQKTLPQLRMQVTSGRCHSHHEKEPGNLQKNDCFEYMGKLRLLGNQVNSILKSEEPIEGKWVTQASSPLAKHERKMELP